MNHVNVPSDSKRRQIDTDTDEHYLLVSSKKNRALPKQRPPSPHPLCIIMNRWIIHQCISKQKYMLWEFCSQTCTPRHVGWASHKAAHLTIEKNSNSISTKRLWLSGNTKDTPFFCTVAFSCFVNCNDIKEKITAKDNYKPFEKLAWIAVLTHLLFCLIQLIDAVRWDFWFDSITSMNTKGWIMRCTSCEGSNIFYILSESAQPVWHIYLEKKLQFTNIPFHRADHWKDGSTLKNTWFLAGAKYKAFNLS